jgi:Ca-activated chloride channel family protein
MSQRKYKYNFVGMLIAAAVLEIVLWLAIAVVLIWLTQVMPGLRFERPELLWLMAVGPLMFLIFIFMVWVKNRRFDKFAEADLLGFLVAEVSSVNLVAKYLLWRIAAACLVVALINPQLGSKMTETKVEGIEVMIAVDVSNSMLAEDLKPNRMTLARRAIERFVDKLRGDRVGIVVFAGEAYVQLPITNDYSAAKLFLNAVAPDIVPTQGTAIGAAIKKSVESFDFSSAGQKAIIIISDGENHEDDAVGNARDAASKGVKVYTIGIGTTKGAPIPQLKNGQKVGFRKDRDGSTVISRINEDMLREVASAGGGTYVRASAAEVGLNNLLEELNALEKADLGSVSYAEYEDRFQVFLVLALMCLLTEALLNERRSKLSERIKIFDR